MSENIKQVLEFLEKSTGTDGEMTRYIHVDPDDMHLEFSYPHAPNIQPNTVCITYLELIEALRLAIKAQRPSTPDAKQALHDFVNNMTALPPVVGSVPGHVMTQPEARLARYDKFMAKAREIVTSKNHDYAGGKVDVDPNANFVEIARLLEGAPITPYTVAMIYKLKHVFSLLTYAKTGRQESGEALTGRHQDDSNYSFILNELMALHEACFAHYSVPDDGSDEKLAA